MRLVLWLLVLALPFAGPSLVAQTNPLSQLSFSRGQLAQRNPLSQLSLSRGQPGLSIRTYVFEPASSPEARPATTCPMPVARMNSAHEDPMPVARGGTPEAMPIARSGCWNPLFPEWPRVLPNMRLKLPAPTT